MFLGIVFKYVIIFVMFKFVRFVLSAYSRLDLNVYLNVYIFFGVKFFGSAFWRLEILYIC